MTRNLERTPAVDRGKDSARMLAVYRTQEPFFRALDWLDGQPENVRQQVALQAAKVLDESIGLRQKTLNKELNDFSSSQGGLGARLAVLALQANLGTQALLAKVFRDPEALWVLGQGNTYSNAYAVKARELFLAKNPSWQPETGNQLRERFTRLKNNLLDREFLMGKDFVYGGLDELGRITLSRRYQEYEALLMALGM